MTKFADELQRALARQDSEKLIRQLEAYNDYYMCDCNGDWPEEYKDDFAEILDAPFADHEKAFAYVIIADSRYDDAHFLGLLACSLLEDILHDPSAELLERVVAEARKSARFRWLLSNPYKVAVAPRVWAAIEQFRTTGPHEEPAPGTLPPR